MAIGAPNPGIKTVKHLELLQQKSVVGRVTDGKEHARLHPAVTLDLRHIDEKPPGGVAPVKQPEQAGDPRRGGHADGSGIVQPEDFQQTIKLLQLKAWKILLQLCPHLCCQSSRYINRRRQVYVGI